MSINRLLLRSLACVALQQQADDDRPPTMAGVNVFDSKLDPAVFEETTSQIPAVIVYTDHDDATLQNFGSGDGPYLRHINLRVEIVIGSFDSTVTDGVSNVSFAVPTTDAELEGRLDLFETQAKWALMALPGRAYSDAFRSFVVMIEGITSEVIRDETSANKFATRRITFKCRVNDDCVPRAFKAAAGQLPPPRNPIDLSQFPSPWLRDVLSLMQYEPSLQNALDVLSQSGNPAVVLPLLQRIGSNIEVRSEVGFTGRPDLGAMINV